MSSNLSLNWGLTTITELIDCFITDKLFRNSIGSYYMLREFYIKNKHLLKDDYVDTNKDKTLIYKYITTDKEYECDDYTCHTSDNYIEQYMDETNYPSEIDDIQTNNKSNTEFFCNILRLFCIPNYLYNGFNSVATTPIMQKND